MTHEDRYPMGGLSITAEEGSILWTLSVKVLRVVDRQTRGLPPCVVRVSQVFCIRTRDDGEVLVKIPDPDEVKA